MTEQTNSPVTGSPLVKRGLADMLKGGVIMDVVTPEQAKIADAAGAVAPPLRGGGAPGLPGRHPKRLLPPPFGQGQLQQ